MSNKFERVRVRVKEQYDRAGRFGWQVGPQISEDQPWIPVMWDDADDPDFFKKAGLEFLEHGQEQRELRETILSTVTDLVSQFVYYGRKEDEELSAERLEKAFEDGVVTYEEVAAHFLKNLKAAGERRAND